MIRSRGTLENRLLKATREHEPGRNMRTKPSLHEDCRCEALIYCVLTAFGDDFVPCRAQMERRRWKWWTRTSFVSVAIRCLTGFCEASRHCFHRSTRFTSFSFSSALAYFRLLSCVSVAGFAFLVMPFLIRQTKAQLKNARERNETFSEAWKYEQRSRWGTIKTTTDTTMTKKGKDFSSTWSQWQSWQLRLPANASQNRGSRIRYPRNSRAIRTGQPPTLYEVLLNSYFIGFLPETNFRPDDLGENYTAYRKKTTWEMMVGKLSKPLEKRATHMTCCVTMMTDGME